MTFENAQRSAIADLDQALAEALKREQTARLLAEDMQRIGHRLERQLAEARQEADALRRKLDEAEAHAAGYRRQFDSLKALYQATANDRDLMARRAAVAETELDRLTAARPWWWRALPWT